jgi:hypothetical protein
MNEASKSDKIEGKPSNTLRMQRQKSNCRKEISILAEMERGSGNGKLNKEKKKDLKKYIK